MRQTLHVYPRTTRWVGCHGVFIVLAGIAYFFLGGTVS